MSEGPACLVTEACAEAFFERTDAGSGELWRGLIDFPTRINSVEVRDVPVMVVVDRVGIEPFAKLSVGRDFVRSKRIKEGLPAWPTILVDPELAAGGQQVSEELARDDDIHGRVVADNDVGLGRIERRVFWRERW